MPCSFDSDQAANAAADAEQYTNQAEVQLQHQAPQDGASAAMQRAASVQSEAAPLLGEHFVMLRVSVHACCLSWQLSAVCMTFSHVDAADQVCMPCRARSQSQWGGCFARSGCSTATSLDSTVDFIYPKVNGPQQVCDQVAYCRDMWCSFWGRVAWQEQPFNHFCLPPLMQHQLEHAFSTAPALPVRLHVILEHGGSLAAQVQPHCNAL